MRITKYMGYSFMTLAILNLLEIFGLEYFILDTVYPTCLAIAGVLFMVTDYITFHHNIIQHLRKMETKQSDLMIVFKREGVDTTGLERNPRTLGKLSRLIEIHSVKVISVINGLAVFAIFILPQLKVVNMLFQNENLIVPINNFSVFMGIGISVYLSDLKVEYKKFEDETNEIAEDIYKMSIEFKEIVNNIDLPPDERTEKIKEFTKDSFKRK
ncbi:hypothetical protein ABFG93_20980 [Pseudalkalibacillus hwajinpoensis]|uniref:hypothetical protein n=1 Tax=Guptibacillus hwajinpoensis TaxID=208199 RepID=UPI00325B892D